MGRGGQSGTQSKADLAGGAGGHQGEGEAACFLRDYREWGSLGRDMGLSAETCSLQLLSFVAR